MIVFISSELVVSIFFGFIIYVLIRCRFIFSDLDWIGFFRDAVELKNFTFHIVIGCVFVFLTIIYAIFVNKNVLAFFKNGSLRGKGKLHSVKSNLENSRWMNKKEKNKLFKPVMYSKLKELSKDGIPVAAAAVNKGKDLEVRFNSPCHALVIGSTGSGKTTTFVSPMIQLLAATKANSSMVITDPKGELFNLHSKYLEEKGRNEQAVKLVEKILTTFTKSDLWKKLVGTNGEQEYSNICLNELNSKELDLKNITNNSIIIRSDKIQQREIPYEKNQ